MQPPRPADLEGRLIANSVHARLFPGDERPTRIGNYVIIRRIGGGAMGDVFLAHHESLDRQAAIKLVRPAAEDSTIERQRLLREATILAKIDHPHVIGVHDSGTHDNRVYLAMEYVKGVTLGVWQKGRPWRALLDVYLKAGRGLQAVHAVVLDADERNATGTTRRCLCHRDFKPDNVLISDHGDVRVADFGLAVPTQRRDPGQGGRAIDLRLTADASVVGTPLYISPEQLGGSPGDARSDQYSFCVALYEALYDQHPYYAPAPAVRDSELATDSGGPGGTTPQFALFEAILGAPLRPAPRSKVPRRIHTILARGLQRDPAARYPSMAALLAALEHDPKRRPLQAFAGIAVIGTAFGVGMGLATAIPEMCSNIEQETANLWNDARREEVKAAFVKTGASYAGNNFAAVDHGITDYLNRWTITRQAACDATYQSGSQTHEALERSMSCLDRQLARARSVVSGFTNIEPSAISSAPERLDILPDPEDCNARHLHALSCDFEPLNEPVRAQIEAATATELSGRYLEAEPLAAAAAAAARINGAPTLVIDAQFTYGRILTALGRPALALDALLTAREAAEAASCETATIDIDAHTAKLVALNPQLEVYPGQLATTMGLAKLKRPEQHDPRRKAQMLSDRGLLHQFRLGNIPAAQRDYQEAIDLRNASGLDQTDAQARTQQNLGTVLAQQGHFPEAIAALRSAIDLYRGLPGEDHPELWKAALNFGLVHHEAGQLEEAKVALNEALALAKASIGDTSPGVQNIHFALARLAFDLGDGNLAQANALAGLIPCDPEPERPLCIDLKLQLAHARILQGDKVKALELREQTFALSRLQFNELDLLNQHIDLAGSLVSAERWEEALDHALAASKNLRDPRDRRNVETSLYLGEALLGLQQAEQAIVPLARAHDLAGDEDPDFRATAAWDLARSWCAGGRAPAKAEGFARQAREYFASDPADSEAADLVLVIDEWLRSSSCLPKPKR